MSLSSPVRSRMRRALPAAVALAGAAATIFAPPAAADPPAGVYDPHVEYSVTAPNDAGDASVGDGVCRTSGGRCTLRAALQEAAVDQATSTIRFTCMSNTKNTIKISTALPNIRDLAGPTIVDGALPEGFTAKCPMIELRGPGSNSTVNGLTITSPGNIVRNLSIYDFRNQIRITGWSNRITANLIGTNRDGTFDASRQLTITEDTAGVQLDSDASNNLIDANAIAGNADIGVLARGTASANTIARNDIGLTFAGVRPNGSHGVVLGATTRFNTVGGDRAAGNAIAANRGSGIQIGGTLNRVTGNTIGLRLRTGSEGGVIGIREIVAPNADTNVVVGPSAEARISENVVVGKPDGVVIGTEVMSPDSEITGVRVTSNEIGRSSGGETTGSMPDPTGATGVTVWYGSHVVLAYNAVRRQQIGFLIAERRPALPVTQIGNVFENNGTDVVFRPVAE